MDFLKDTLNLAKSTTNNAFHGKEPWQIASITATTVFISAWMWDFLFRRDESITERTKKTAFRLLKQVPQIKQKLEKESEKMIAEFEREVAERIKGQKIFGKLPPIGMDEDKIVSIVQEHLNLGSYDWKKGKVSGAVYYYDKELIHLITTVYGLASYTNPLHQDIFPGINKMEAEVVRMTGQLFNSNKKTCGSMTTGGTESILLAVKAYRDYAREEKGITKPELVVPITAHSAFDKAAQFLKIRIRYIPVYEDTTVNISAMRRAINSNTILLVGSAPNFPYGTMDNMEEISKLGVKYNIPVHVDCCLGGFVVALASKLGYDVPQFDFRLPGVTSISADPHKYGFAPKGSSVILYSERKYRHHQYTVTTDWPGGVYGSPTVSGSRAGGIIAACWATMLYFGANGYLNSTTAIMNTSKYIEKELRSMDGIYIFGKPVTSVIAFGSKVFNIYLLSDALAKKGWNLNSLQFPSGIHICVTHLHTKPGVADQLLNDIRTELAIIMKEPKQPVEGMYAVYGAAQGIPDRSIVGNFIRYFIDASYHIPETEAIIENGK